MSQILGSRHALQDLVWEHLADHPLRLPGECSERGKASPAQYQPHVPTLHQEALRQGDIILQMLPSTERTPFSLWAGKSHQPPLDQL